MSTEAAIAIFLFVGAAIGGFSEAKAKPKPKQPKQEILPPIKEITHDKN